ncbi:MAG TPA: EamA family transporter [Aliidongia sp.]|uniref:EamA family transporter n=1 Tax=Aliidongia sp. TaxID=1914230 RepID=UPI002DDCD1F7|nr:EamA family transporter [Aliidongia sp.]HEV2673870.1 EamA family transporter [Aliidongia sp.]
MPITDMLLASLVALLWGGNFTVVRLGLDGGMPPLLFAALRFAVASGLMLVVPRPAVPWRMVATLGIVLGVGLYGLSTVSIAAGMAPGLGSLVLQSQAFMTIALAALVLGERPPAIVLLGTLVAFAGLALIGLGGGAGSTFAGLAITLAAAACWAASNILIKRLGGVDMLALSVWMSPVAAVALAILSILFEDPAAAWAHRSWSTVAVILYAGPLSAAAGSALWGTLLKRHPASRVAPFSLLVPVFGLVIAAICLDERLDQTKVAAGGLVFAGLALVVFKPRFRRRSAARIL